MHLVSGIRLMRRCSAKLDALATMIELERQTYEQWLSQPQFVLNLLHKYFTSVHESFAWDKCRFVGMLL